MTKLTRRSFVRSVSLTAAGAALAARSWARVPGANSDIRVAMVGLGGRSKDHLKAYDSLKGVRVVALCDPDSEHLERNARARRARGDQVQTFADIRELLARDDIDTISIASPNHWHALMAIWACQAGKDVYVEKPVSHNVWEGRQEVKAAAKHSRIVQTGTQSRSRRDLMESVAWIRAGNLGKIKSVHGLCYKRRPSIGLTHGPQPVPATVDYNLWTGPAPLLPLRRHRLHYDWHWVWPTGCGDLGNQGVHQMDVARWFLGDPGLAPHSLTVGGRVGYVDDGETPNTVAAVHDYPEAPLVFEVRGLPAHKGTEEMDLYPDARVGCDVGVIVHCEGGTLVAPNGPPLFKSATTRTGEVVAYDKQGRVVKKFATIGENKLVSEHVGNFLAAVRSRRQDSLHASIECGHRSSALCHVANISYRLGQGLPADQMREQVAGNPAMAEACGRMLEHLRANDVVLAPGSLKLGVPLAADPAAERFTGNAAANELLTRHYRPPFVVPAVS